MPELMESDDRGASATGIESPTSLQNPPPRRSRTFCLWPRVQQPPDIESNSQPATRQGRASSAFCHGCLAFGDPPSRSPAHRPLQGCPLPATCPVRTSHVFTVSWHTTKRRTPTGRRPCGAVLAKATTTQRLRASAQGHRWVSAAEPDVSLCLVPVKAPNGKAVL